MAGPVSRRQLLVGVGSLGAVVGTPATLNAKTLAANSDVEITWITMVGNRSVTGFEERTKSMGTTRTDANGAFTWAFKVPDDLGGDHVLSAKIGGTDRPHN